MTNSSVLSPVASVCREERSSTRIDRGDIAECSSKDGSGKPHQLIKLAVDVHGKFYTVARQVDNAVAQPPQNMSPQQFLTFVSRQLSLADSVVSCYEAGCFGFVLHRQIEALGARNLVVAPQDWDERHTGARTDKTDTKAMLSRLDRYLAGNVKALAVVRVPSLGEEVSRSRVRQRKQFQGDRNVWANRGRSLLQEFGVEGGWSWWKTDRYPKVKEGVSARLPDEQAKVVLTMLEDCRQMVLKAGEKLEELTVEQHKQVRERRQKDKAREQQDKAAQDDRAYEGYLAYRIKGMGELSVSQIYAEVGDWRRFSNRRQVASYTGLCPGVSGSGGKFVSGSITKHGNQRLRCALVELAWLIVRYQSTYPPAVYCRAVMKKAGASARKRAIVALARKLAVDLWRLETGRMTPQQLGLTVLKAA